MATTAPLRSLARARRAGAVMLLSALLVGGLSACSGEDPSQDGLPSASASPAPAPLATTAKAGTIRGRLGAQQRDRAVQNVTDVVDGWFDAAFVGGDYPRESFSEAFPLFTKGAQELALRDVMLMSNADLSQRIDGATAKVRRVTVDLLGTRGVARAATARVRLVFVTEGSVARQVTVAGRLRLVRQGQAWRVFGYDITKADEVVPDPTAEETGQ